MFETLTIAIVTTPPLESIRGETLEKDEQDVVVSLVRLIDGCPDTQEPTLGRRSFLGRNRSS